MFDPVFKNDVDIKTRRIINELPGACTQEQASISRDDVRKAARQLKCRKACGYDGIFNEHLKNGGSILYEQLALLYTDMYNHGHIPEGLKKGIIITLHKGGRKSKSDPNNYRAITLTSCIFKLFERILLQRVETSLNTPLNILQGGFRTGLSCNMSSLMLKECISFTKENHSKLFVCFLDVQKAFDCVWHNGLFVKLYDMGIRSNLLRVIINMHRGMKRSVLYKGHYSDWFDILQGLGQGGVLSPVFYLCFIDELINLLVVSKYGFRINSRSICSPAVADDMLLMALSKLGLDELLRICFLYSCKWRYEYGPLKCSVIVFNETRGQFVKSNRKWLLGPHTVKEEESYKYLGTMFSKYLSLKANIKDASDKLKGTFVSLVNNGIIHENGLHPLSCQKIYKCIVLPKALYGCENWSNMTESDVLNMERAHRFCIKFMQGLHRRTRTDIALSIISIYSIESEIDFRKLILFGQLCRLNFEHWLRVVFLNRLCTYSMNGSKQTGFIPDIVSILGKYCLLDVFTAYKRDGVFPSRLTWNRRVRKKIQEREEYLWHSQTLQPEFSRFKRIHCNYTIHFAWTLSKNYPKLTSAARSLIQMTSFLTIDADNARLCYRCNMNYVNIIDHCISECPYVHLERVSLWDRIYQFNPDVYMFLMRLDKETLTNVFLGEALLDLVQLLPEDDRTLFWYICLPALHAIWSRYYHVMV